VTETDEPKIVEAVPNIVPGGKLAWVRFSDDTHTEIATTPPRTVGELRALIEHLPDATPVLTSGYEDYWGSLASVCITQAQELDGLPDYVGRFVTPAEAEHEVAGKGGSGWQFTRDPQQRPTLVGEPVYALILGRGRP
jgi:hypothetical protein